MPQRCTSTVQHQKCPSCRLQPCCRDCDHQEERERAERAEDQLDQLTRSLAQEKSTSSALQAERAALERLQVLRSLSGTTHCSPMAAAALLLHAHAAVVASLQPA